ncbi:UNVERIFIED_CONTAM: hypothetical protein K2H54_036942 [Gekko kuhli]
MAEDTKRTADLKECEEDLEERIFEINEIKKNRHSFGQESNNIQADKTTFTLMAADSEQKIGLFYKTAVCLSVKDVIFY